VIYSLSVPIIWLWTSGIGHTKAPSHHAESTAYNMLGVAMSFINAKENLPNCSFGMA
jgi:hypothetical protein